MTILWTKILIGEYFRMLCFLVADISTSGIDKTVNASLIIERGCMSERSRSAAHHWRAASQQAAAVYLIRV